MSSSTTHTATIGAIGAPSRRNTELALLVFAVVIPVFAYANVGLAMDGKLPAGMLGYGAGPRPARGRRAPRRAQVRAVRRPAAAAARHPAQRPGPGAHLAARPVRAPAAAAETFSPAAPNQLMYSALGVALFVGVLHLPQGPPRPAALHLHLHGRRAGPADPAARSSRQNVSAPRSGSPSPAFSIQPGEFAKIVIAVFFAGYLMVKRDALALASRRFMGLYLPRGRDLGPDPRHLGDLDPHPGLRDRPRHVAAVLRHVRRHAVRRHRAHQLDRLRSADVRRRRGRRGDASSRTSRRACSAWLDPLRESAEPGGVGGHSEQATQALWAFGSGGTLGSGLGQGNSDLIGFAANSDFILATVGEELGLAGMMADPAASTA